MLPGRDERPRDALLESYKRQDKKYGRREFRRDYFAVAIVLLVLAAVLGPSPLLFLNIPIIVLYASFLPWVSLLMFGMIVLAVWQDDLFAARVGGYFGLLMIPFFFLGTILSLLSLYMLSKAESWSPARVA